MPSHRFKKFLLIFLIKTVLTLLVVFAIATSKSYSATDYQPVAQRGAAGDNSGLTLTIPLSNPTAITTGNNLTLRLTMSATRTITVTDPRGNTWQQDALGTNGTGTSRTAVYSNKVTTPYQEGDSIVVTLSGSTAVAMAGIIDEWSGFVDSNWLDTTVQAGADSSSPSSNAWDSGTTASTAQAKSLLFGVIGYSTSASTITPAVVSPTWDALGSQTSPGTFRTVAGHYRKVTSIGTYNYAGSFTSTKTHLAILVVYKLKTLSTPPTAPSSLTASATHTNRVLLNWQDNSSDESSFSIQRAPDVSGSPGSYSDIGTVNGNVTYYRDYTTSANTKYWYRVYAVNEAGNSSYSNAVSATTPSGSGEGISAVPVDIGIWINKTELDNLPITGGDSRVDWWTRMKGAADAAWPAEDLYTDGDHNIYTMAGALTFARLKPADGSADTYADAMRTKVRDAIESVINQTIDNTNPNTRPSRFIATYVISADLINLRDFDPELNDRFEDWLNTILYTDFNTGGGAPSIYDQGYARATNTANMARTTLAAAFRYMGNNTELDKVALWTASFAGDATSRATHATSITPPNWQIGTYTVDPWSTSDYSDSFGAHYWQPTPGDTTTYYGILPTGSSKNDRNGSSVNLDGVSPGDWGRNGPFVTQDSPYTGLPHDPPYSTTPYNWTTTRGLAPGILILQRAGYPAKDWGDQALKRLMDANWRFYQNYSSRGWTWTTDSTSEWVPPLINYIYGASYLNDFTRTSTFGISGQGENIGWTQWTHEGRVLGGSSLDHFEISTIGSQTAGSAFNISITAKDANNDTVTSFTDPVDISSNGTIASGSGTTANFVAGVLSAHSITISNTGTFTIDAIHAVDNLYGTSNSFTVGPNVVNKLVITSYPSATNAGTETTAYTVTRYDQFDNLVTSGAQDVSLTSDSTGPNKSFRLVPSGPTITSLTISDGNSNGTFYYYDDVPGIYSIAVSYIGLTGDSKSLTVNSVSTPTPTPTPTDTPTPTPTDTPTPTPTPTDTPTPTPTPTDTPTPTPTPTETPVPTDTPTPTPTIASNSQPSGNSNEAKPPGCNSTIPVGKPDLFQIDRSGGQATLYFTPVNSNVENYNVVFGFSEGDERFGGLLIKAQNDNQGVQSIVINYLDPKANYSFKVISTNGCAVGEWSNWLSANRVQAKTSIFYRYYSKVKNIF